MLKILLALYIKPIVYRVCLIIIRFEMCRPRLSRPMSCLGYISILDQLYGNFYFSESEIRIRKGFIRNESLHRQGICFGRKVHTINI